MIPIAGQPVLTVAGMRATEGTAMREGASVDSLMTRAGNAVAEAVHRLAGSSEVLILCGPGNNGGDGYVAAARLQTMGIAVRVAATGDPKTEAALRALAEWTGPVASIAEASPAPVLVDAIFGTGLVRPLASDLCESVGRLLAGAHLSIAVDVPSGVATDDGAILGRHLGRARFDVTLALGAVKPAHVLEPAATVCGAVRVLDIGVAVASDIRVIAPPELPTPMATSHKYSRGMVAVVAGEMRGAARLAATAAARAGAGYVAVYGDAGSGGPDAMVHRALSVESLRAARIGAILIGPGLGRGDPQRALLNRLIEEDIHPLVIDGDALHLIDPDQLVGRGRPVLLTPHAGEFDALFGKSDASLIDRSRDAADRTQATIVFKGATTLIASGGYVTVSPRGNPWLSTAGTGDVLAGAIAAMLAVPGADPYAAAVAGVWLHAQAAHQLGAAFIADDLAAALSAARANG